MKPQTHTPKKEAHYISATTQFTDRGSEQLIVNAEGFVIGKAINEYQAAFIVKAVNCHEEMLGMVKELLSELSWTCQKNPQYGIESTVKKAQEIIAKAEGE